MKITTKVLFIYAVLCLTFPVKQSLATTLITPSWYTTTPGEGSYIDDTGQQLIDGIIGTNEFETDLGNGSAYEWIGWIVTDPVINFTFNSSVTISQVLIGFNRYAAAGIYLPKNITINGKSFTLTGTEIADRARGFLTFNGPFTGSTVNISLSDGDNNRWIFVDEVQFVSLSVGGSVTGEKGKNVICQNLTTKQSVVIKLKGITSWDCQAAGLVTNPGDVIKQIVNGAVPK